MSCNMHRNPDVRRWIKVTNKHVKHIVAIDPESLYWNSGVCFRTIAKARTYQKSHPNTELYRLKVHRGQHGYFKTQ